MVQELMCGHRERLGDLEQAGATFRAAESLDPSWPLTLMSLARLAKESQAHRSLAARVTNGEEDQALLARR